MGIEHLREAIHIWIPYSIVITVYSLIKGYWDPWVCRAGLTPNIHTPC